MTSPEKLIDALERGPHIVIPMIRQADPASAVRLRGSGGLRFGLRTSNFATQYWANQKIVPFVGQSFQAE